MSSSLRIVTYGRGLYDVTHKVRMKVNGGWVDEAVVTVLLRHTSGSLLIQAHVYPKGWRDIARSD